MFHDLPAESCVKLEMISEVSAELNVILLQLLAVVWYIYQTSYSNGGYKPTWPTIGHDLEDVVFLKILWVWMLPLSTQLPLGHLDEASGLQPSAVPGSKGGLQTKNIGS